MEGVLERKPFRHQTLHKRSEARDAWKGAGNVTLMHSSRRTKGCSQVFQFKRVLRRKAREGKESRLRTSNEIETLCQKST